VATAAMTDAVAHLARPQRWDGPFGPDMTDADVQRLLARPEFAGINADRFPRNTPLAGILKNDARLVRCQPGDIVVREGDYGNSAFLILTGKLRVVLAPGLPGEMLGRLPAKKKSFLAALAQLWTNRRIPEVRDVARYQMKGLRKTDDAAASRVFLQDVPAVLDEHKTALLEAGALFGELAALGRVPRTATVFAEADAELLEIRWQGLRDLRKFDDGWRKMIDERYRANALKVHLRATPLFAGLDETTLQRVVDSTLFETYGTFDWHVSYKRLTRAGEASVATEPAIARQGDYTDGLILIRAGFARVTTKLGHGERTLTYLSAGDAHGLEELYAAWKNKAPLSLATSLTAVGYVDALRVPARILEEFVFPNCRPPTQRLAAAAERPLADDALVEWLVDERFINGTKAMLIDLDKCVRCDDCVRACASTHGGNPRFLREGKTFDHWMVTHACMHCADPVCMIGCPTGAIHRSQQAGIVVINDDTCIGCGTCANSCPYENIFMVGINDPQGRPLIDPKDQRQIQKATKCDLCEQQLGGPACVRACPHDALTRVDFRHQEWR
jgi:Fe-S-cluster-containing dehydrogenase component/CRP-like cAMP-binding protein